MPKKNKDSKIISKKSVAVLQDDWLKCDQSLEDVRAEWEDREKIFFGITPDDLTNNVAKSKAYDPILSTIVIERAARVMAQSPTGKVKALDSADSGKSQLADLILEKYIKPNANSQFHHDIKLRLWDIYSMVYGSMPMLVDYRVDDEYVGPDCWLIPMRQYYPQSGVYQVKEMDYAYIDSFVSLEWLKARDKKIWKNIDELEAKIKETEGKKKSSYPYRSYAEEKWGQSDYGGKGKFAQILLRTRYERDKWITYSPDYSLILREIENPHQNNKLPIVVKETLPLLDRNVGLGEIERGKSLQFTANSLLNLHLDGIKMSMYPPTIFNPNGIVASSIINQPGARWLETVPNSIRSHQVSPQGINTFTSTYPFIKGELLSQAGTTDTSTSSNVEPTMGKTPEALKQTAMRESSRDSWDRKMMEQAVEELYDRFVDLITKKQEKPIEFAMFGKEIQKIQQLYPDVVEMFGEDSGKVKINPKLIKNSNFKFYIEPGTSMAKDTAMENQALSGILTLIMKAPQIVQEMQSKGKMIDIAELIKRWVATSGVQDWEKIIVDFQPQGGNVMGQPQPNLDLSVFQDPQIQQLAQEMFGQGGQNGTSNQAGNTPALPQTPPVGQPTNPLR